MSKHVRFGLFALALLAAVGLIAPTHAEVPAETEPLFAEVPADGCVVDATASPLDVPAEQEPFMASCASGISCPHGMVALCPQYIDYSVSCQNNCCTYTYTGSSCGNPSEPVCSSDNDCTSNESCVDGCCTGCDGCAVDGNCPQGQTCNNGCCS